MKPIDEKERKKGRKKQRGDAGFIESVRAKLFCC